MTRPVGQPVPNPRLQRTSARGFAAALAAEAHSFGDLGGAEIK